MRPPNTHTIHIFKNKVNSREKAVPDNAGKEISLGSLTLGCVGDCGHGPWLPGRLRTPDHCELQLSASQYHLTVAPEHGLAFLQQSRASPLSPDRRLWQSFCLPLGHCPLFHLPSGKLLSCFCRFHSVFRFLGEALKYVAGSGCL